jgi:hypothetical protein
VFWIGCRTLDLAACMHVQCYGIDRWVQHEHYTLVLVFNVTLFI